jgi:hypothetical protein
VSFARLAPLALLALACACAGSAHALRIDFETVPGGPAADGLVVADQFQAGYGVRFALEGGGFPQLAEANGAPRTAFGGPPDNAPDTPAPGHDAGRFFLTDDGAIGAPPPALIVSFDVAMAHAHLVILDIDGWPGASGMIFEAFRVEARDAGGALLDAIVRSYPEAGTGDGVATLFAFDRPDADIRSLRVSYDASSSKTWGVGFALDDLWLAIPEPGTLALVASGVTALAARARRR